MAWHAQPPRKASVDVEGACSGDWTGGVIVDEVLVPKQLKPGRYVLGWSNRPPPALESNPMRIAHC